MFKSYKWKLSEWSSFKIYFLYSLFVHILEMTIDHLRVLHWNDWPMVTMLKRVLHDLDAKKLDVSIVYFVLNGTFYFRFFRLYVKTHAHFKSKFDSKWNVLGRRPTLFFYAIAIITEERKKYTIKCNNLLETQKNNTYVCTLSSNKK